MNLKFLAFTLDIIGKVLVAYTALAVHGRVQKEKEIDASVFHAMKWEKVGGISGIIFMIIGYILHIL